MALKHIRQCPACETKLFEGGKYCPCCGHEFDEALSLTKEQIMESGFRSFCQHCFPVRALVESHQFCPYCNGEMHLYIDALEDANMIAGSEFANLTFRIRKVGLEPVTFLEVRAVSLGEDLNLGKRRIYPESVLHESDAEVEIDFHYDPGERAGRATVEIEIVYVVGRNRCKVFGTHDLRIARTTKNLTSVTFNVEGHMISDDVKVFGGMEDESGFSTEVVEQQHEGTVGRYIPLECRYSLLKEEEETINISPPQWAPAQTARIWFETNGKLYNYCLLTQPSLIFGRRESACDVRIVEVELCLANFKRQAREGVPEEEQVSDSYVSGRQWQIEPKSNGVRVTQLSKQSSILKPSGNEILKGEIQMLSPDDSIEVPARVGLHYAADATKPPQIQDWYAKMSEILGSTSSPWSGERGGYRLDRIYSLTNSLPEGLENFNTLERYILMPGWCTIGSSPEACIHIPDPSVAAVHAYLLFAEGYFFVVPAFDSKVEVDEQLLKTDMPVAVGFEQRIKLGSTTLVFDKFAQMHV